MEDHPGNRALLIRQFEQLGCVVESMERAEQALEVLRIVSYDLLVTDLHLNGQSGEWLLDQLRSLSLAAPPRVVVLTGEASAATHERLRRDGAQEVLVKPVDLLALRAMLERQCSSVVARRRPESRSSRREARAQTAVLDPSVLEAVLGEGNLAHATQVVRLCIDGMDAALPELRRGLMAKDATLVTRICHRQRGAAQSIGASGCASVLSELECAVREEEWGVAHQTVQELLESVDELRTFYLDRYQMGGGQRC